MIRNDARYWIGRAFDEGWAIGMFNAHHLEAVQAIADAAQRARAPVMLSTTMGGLKHVGLNYFVGMASAARASVDVPLILHLDHGADFATVEACIKVGFDSVMIDASTSDYDHNVEKVRRVVTLARRHGVGVEAQIGETLAEEGAETVERKSTPGEVARFIADTDVDYLAVSIGNAPGTLEANADIDLPLVKRLVGAAGRPLVLHGGTSVPADTVRALVAAGVAKVNIDAAIKGSFLEALVQHYSAETPMIDTRVPLADARNRASVAVGERIAAFGAVGRAESP